MRRNMLVAVAVAAAIAHAQAEAQTAPLPAPLPLPVPCAGGACGANASGFVTAGSASAVQSGNTLNVHQQSANATLNWQSFDIARGNTVNFRQPDSASIALNRIFQGSNPSQILGSLNANGRVFLINQSGIVFGEGAQVNVGGLLASTLNMTPEAAERGIGRASSAGRPAFEAFRDPVTNEKLQSAAITIESGAQINAAGGQVLVFAPEVTNRGTIRTPDGQTMLAAGESIYLAESSELRGLLVEIDTGDTASGIVTNGTAANASQADPARLAGQIIAERGNITLAGLAVNQLGRVSATTSVRSNGTIRLVARDGGSASAQAGSAPALLNATRGGDLTLGARSSTTVTLDRNDAERTVDVNTQPRSLVELEGAAVRVLDAARVTATSGQIRATARENSQLDPANFSATGDGSRIYVAPGAVLDASGASVDLPVDRNIIKVELRGSQLANSPLQRDGELRSEPVNVDIRVTGTRPDGSTWRGTPLADVSGDISTIARNVQERSLTGGNITLRSQGDVLLSETSTLDISGGQINFLDGFINTSRLLGDDGRVYEMSAADPTRLYTRVLNGAVVQHERWGVTQQFGVAPGRFERGYVEGKDAGSVAIYAPNVALDGAIRAHTVVGTNQRQAPQAVAATDLYRPFDQRPLGGELVLGNIDASLNALSLRDYVLPDLEVAAGAVLSQLRSASGGAFDPLVDPLPRFDSVRLRPELLADGVSRIRAVANGAFTLPAASGLDLGVFGTLDFTAGSADIAGAIRAPSGSVRITTQATAGSLLPSDPAPLLLRDSARIDVAGTWINDNLLLNPVAATAPVAINGGSISLSGTHVTAEPGSALIADGGAWRRSDGSLRYGNGGRLSFASSGLLPEERTLALDGSMSAYAFARGGSLSISTGALCISSAACNVSPDAYRVTPAQLTSGGFENYSFTSTLEDLFVEAGTHVELRQQNFVFEGAVSGIATGTALADFTRTGVLPDAQRRATNLTLAASRPSPFLALQDNIDDAAELVLAAGSSISADPRAAISLSSNARVRVDGIVSAPSGNISITLDSTLPVADYIDSHGIWLGESARLNAAGVPLVTINSLGLRTGQVFDGGLVSLNAQRGSLVMQRGSVLDVSGTSATLDLPSAGIGSGATQPVQVASAGGTIQLSAAEGLFANSTLRAASGDPGTLAGGTIAVTLNTGNRGNDPGGFNAVFPGTPRRIEISETVAPVVIEYGNAAPPALNGRALISASALRESGADTLAFTARNVRGDVNGAEVVRSEGRVVFNGDLQLSPRARLSFDAAIIESLGGTARLSASHVSIGNTDPFAQPLTAAPVSGVGVLDVRAGLVDLAGASIASGFSRVSLESRGDLRLRGVQGNEAASVPGTFTTAGELRLAAQQIYPTTFSTFALEARGDGESLTGRIIVDRVAGTPGDVYSAGGSLTLRADDIVHRGSLRAPFGELTLDADDITLESGSLVSTSADDLIIPFGTTQGGFDWTYLLPNGQTLEFGADARPLPSQRVSLDAERIDFREGATVDVSGGGDLQAYEFIPGPTGTRDILASNIRPNQFAILPAASLAFAPYDAAEHALFGALPGDSIVIPEGAAGVPAGTYALLPSRYALLPGAMLVTAVSGYQDIAPGQTFTRLDGSVVIGAYRTVAGTGLRDARTSGFALTTPGYARLEARYDLTRASTFFGSQVADGTELGFRLPGDAGRLTLTPHETLRLDGSLLASGAGTAARGAALEIATDRLRIVTEMPAAPTPGEVAVLAADLEQLRPESLVIGGRATGGANSRLDVTTSTLNIDGGVRLTAPEMLLVARDLLNIGEGAQLTAAGTAASGEQTLQLQGDAALLRVSTNDRQLQLEREGATGSTGSLRIGAGALVRTGGALRLDATQNFELLGQLDVDDGSLALGAPQISLGTAPADTAGLVLDSAQLASWNVDELELASNASLNIFGPVTLAADRLRLRTPGLVSAGPDAELSIDTGLLFLDNPGDAAQAPESGTGLLHVRAGGVGLATGTFSMSGFANSNLDVAGDIFAHEDGALRASGDLAINARRLAGANAVTYSFAADDNLSFAPPAAGNNFAPWYRDAGLGARFSLTGSSVDLGANILAPAGIVDVIATTGAVRLGAGASIDVSGRAITFDGVTVAAPGGSVRLASRENDIRIDSGARIDVSSVGPADTRAGRIELNATRGTVSAAGEFLGASQTAGRGGEFAIDATMIDNFGALNSRLNAGGFDSLRHVRLRGAGDLVLASGTTLAAHDVRLAADAGRIDVGGVIDARGPAGGSVNLFARDAVTVSGQVLASAQTADGRGGHIRLGSTTAGVDVRAGSVLDVSAGPDAPEAAGEVNLRVSRAVLEQLLDANAGNDTTRIQGTVRGHRLLSLEGFAVYTDADGRLLATDTSNAGSNRLFSEATTFMNGATQLATALGRAGDAQFAVRPGIEIRATGDLTLTADWNLNPWRFGDQPGVLTLRAGDDLRFDRSLSDGFDNITGSNNFLLTSAADSWSYRLAAGADFGAADPLGLLDVPGLTGRTGNFEIASGLITPTFTPRMVRTGTGTIEVAAAGDIRFGNQASVLYTAGIVGNGIPLGGAASLDNRAYPTRGGDITLRAGGNILGAQSNQLVTDWLWRTGRDADGLSPQATGWTVNFARFQQGVAALGGGNVSIRAAGDIDKLYASIPSIGRQVGSALPADNRLEIDGGGVLDVRAGGSILGGAYYTGRGSAYLQAGNGVDRGTAAAPANQFLPIFLLGDNSFEVVARRSLGIGGVTNPTLLPQSRQQTTNINLTSFFSTYGEHSRFTGTAIGGDLTFAVPEAASDDSGALITLLNGSMAITGGQLPQLRFAPPVARLAALSGDLDVDSNLSLLPHPFGNLDLFAGNDLRLGSDSAIIISDADLAAIPTPLSPVRSASTFIPLFSEISGASSLIPFNAPVALHASGGRIDEVPSRLVALAGDVIGASVSTAPQLYSAEPLRVVAGRDVVDLSFNVQNVADASVTSVIAGRDITYRVTRDPGIGALQQINGALLLEGPGHFELVAGRTVDLQTSGGITTRGNADNIALPDGGANVSIKAGLAARQPDLVAFAQEYLAEGNLYNAELIDYLRKVIGQTPPDKAAALTRFGTLSAELRAAFLEQVLLGELRAGGRSAAAPGPGNKDYTRAFTALSTYFPGSNPDLDAHETNPYAGDIRLFFSRIYTLDGGDISLFAPGGEINAGLAAPPVAFGINKPSSQLGVVVQSMGSVNAVSFGDLQVNESRVFAADGGNILVWSTRGDIDAGRGAKTAISAPPPTITFDENGQPVVNFPAALTGSGIQTLATSAGREPGDVDLYAPRGVVNAGDAGIVAGNLTIGATAVLGANNITVSGVSVGVPVDAGGLAAGLSGVSNVASGGSNAATAVVEQGAGRSEQSAPLASAALGWLEVFVEGFGEEICKADDVECLARQRNK